MFSSMFCSVFISERVRHFVRPLFVFGVRVPLCLASGSDLLFCSVRCSGHMHMLMENTNVEFQCRMSMSNANVECQCRMPMLNANVECQCRMPMSNANVECRC